MTGENRCAGFAASDLLMPAALLMLLTCAGGYYYKHHLPATATDAERVAEEVFGRSRAELAADAQQAARREDCRRAAHADEHAHGQNSPDRQVRRAGLKKLAENREPRASGSAAELTSGPVNAGGSGGRRPSGCGEEKETASTEKRRHPRESRDPRPPHQSAKARACAAARNPQAIWDSYNARCSRILEDMR